VEKERFTTAFEAVNRIEDLFQKADDLFQTLPQDIQQAILEYHTENGSLQYCLRWGLVAAGDIREDWHTVVSKLK
jgi:calcineurin-like phosphoesterase